MDNNYGNQCKHTYRRGSNKVRFSCNENCCFRDTRQQSRLTNPFECTSRCCAEDFTKTSDEKNVCFTNEVHVSNDCSECSAEELQEPSPRHSDGICLCCREGKGLEQSKKVVKSVLVYDFPEPKLDDLTISKRDYVPKPLPHRGLPPWHPACKDRWHPLDAPSVKNTIYKRDYTPPIVLPSKRSTESKDQYRYLTEEDFNNENRSQKQHDQTVQYPVWRKTTTGPCETIEVCAKSRLPIFGTLVHESPKENKSYHSEEMERNPEQLQLHGPDCEKHCYSTPLRCHDRRDSKERIRPSSSRAELAAMTIEKNHFAHEGKKVGFATEVCHVEPISESKLNCMKVATEENSEYGGECGDCKNAYCCKRTNSCIQPEGYFTSKDKFQNSFPAHKTESYNNERVEKTLYSRDECYEERSIPSSESEYQTDNNYPKNSEEFSAPHHKASKEFHLKCECDHGCNDSPSRRETSRKVSFEEDSKCSSNYSRPKMNDNSNVHHSETTGHGVELLPSLLGHTRGEVVRPVAAALCTAKHSELSFEDDRPNYNHHCSKDNQQLEHYENSRNFNVKPNTGHSDTDARRDPSLRNEFTVCGGKSLSHVKWWKLGGCANVDRSNDCNGTPNYKMKSSRPVST